MGRSVRDCGRDFSASELELIRTLIEHREPRLARTAPSRAASDAPLPDLAHARSQRLTVPRPSDPRSCVSSQHVRRYSHPGHSPLPSDHMRYFMHSADGRLLAILGLGAATGGDPHPLIRPPFHSLLERLRYLMHQIEA